MRLLTIAAAAISLPVAADAQMPPTFPAPGSVSPESGTVLEIVAEGSATRTPDVATVRGGVVTQARTASAALSANAGKMAAVLAALKGAGIAARDIRTASVSLSPQYRYAEGQAPEITGYQANNLVTIRFRDIARSGAVLDALVAQGANQIDGPDLSVDDADSALDEARADAMKRARARAEIYARAAGLSVSRIMWISEGGLSAPVPPGPIMYARAKATADTQILPGESELKVNLNVRFLLK